MLTQAELKRILSYDPSKGIFHWRMDVSQRVKKSAIVGWSSRDRYMRIQIRGKSYLSHRIAFLYMIGSFPEKDTDHINGQRADNRWANLRETTRTINTQNRRSQNGNNATGLLGAQFHKCSGKFCAAITVNGEKRHIGVYDTAHEAHNAYLAAKRRLHPGCTI